MTYVDDFIRSHEQYRLEIRNCDKVQFVKELLLTQAKTLNVLNQDVCCDILYGRIYDAINGHAQKMRNKNGRWFEDIVAYILDRHCIPYARQVPVCPDTGKICASKRKGVKLIDFVVGSNIAIGTYISEYDVLSCKRSFRERYSQDDWVSKITRTQDSRGTFFDLTLDKHVGQNQTIKARHVVTLPENIGTEPFDICGVSSFTTFMRMMENRHVMSSRPTNVSGVPLKDTSYPSDSIDPRLASPCSPTSHGTE